MHQRFGQVSCHTDQRREFEPCCDRERIQKLLRRSQAQREQIRKLPFLKVGSGSRLFSV